MKFLRKLLPPSANTGTIKEKKASKKRAKGEKKKTASEMLLDEYNEGRILQVDNKINNKEYFAKLEDKGGQFKG